MSVIRRQFPNMQDESKKISIVVVGDRGVGKTSLINRYAYDTFVDDFLTVIFDVKDIEVHDGEKVYQATLVDTYGESDYSRIRCLAYLYPKKPDVILLCFSVNNRSSYENITNEWIPELRHYLPEKPIILIGTKSDLEATITQQEGHELKDTIKASYYIDCSAKEGTGVKTVFDYAATTYTNSKSKRRCTVL